MGCRWRFESALRVGDALHAVQLGAVDEVVGAVFDPLGGVWCRRAAVGRVVFEAAVFRVGCALGVMTMPSAWASPMLVGDYR